MKKALANTRVSVKLRKSEYREEWYLYVEAYPVFQADKPTPQRVREYLNRTITTPIWDKSRNARTDKDGKTTYKPKRDLNGIIQCKSQLDQESCIYADKVRSLRQKEYDNASLYSETDAEQAGNWSVHVATSSNTSTTYSGCVTPIAPIPLSSTGSVCMNC